ncbi:MAG TPA: isocitrate lyase/PEP mutase family protein [Deltaproteobacteria bacterium]|jgi:2-methylisocitrate lyase-like PEP mutase family enzyme|nr:isocitrate lyase/PEP mutase family protein [Deltaproteobacteria bacterium]HQJ08424.1 isocitrate lyase/PEP mutase family protein [Deltaproteobacteria bacterium]
MNKSGLLQRLIDDKKFIMAPGVFDALTAKVAEEQGFQAVYMTGYGTCASNFGFPDLGFLTMSEMVQNASRIADAVDIPLIADADTGYGNPLNVIRTVREYEKAGIAAIHIEDQQWPKRCGHMTGKKVIEADQMVEKIKAAVDTRESMLIIARTDAIATHGFDQAIERGSKYAEAGADIIFIEAPVTREQVEDIPKFFKMKPLLINMAPRTPNVGADELHRMGYSIALYPGVCLAAIIPALREEMKVLKDTGRQKELQDYLEAFMALNAFLKVPEFTNLEQKYKGNG